MYKGNESNSWEPERGSVQLLHYWQLTTNMQINYTIDKHFVLDKP